MKNIILKKITSILLFILIALGITASILNFTTNAYASSAIYSTTTQETSLFWQLVYYLQGRWMYGNYYCVGESSNWVIEP